MNIDAQFNETGGIFHADMGEEREISDAGDGIGMMKI